ncbi:hypothetical protein QQY66_28480 [Streptomyces sp. DG2A-72]|uniref:hypothetical protein n=1 Tax=Streptomyces sp. DG2A-72 TaxID=3051386 RepID=UPI00265C61BA|nr:hypothetical protein [Streptomyces sp. DG2A-72]MDO0935414.1 hypothetical protein [Streptomyces sp. DG2A-72]
MSSLPTVRRTPGVVMRKQAPLFVVGILAVTVLTACGTGSGTESRTDTVTDAGTETGPDVASSAPSTPTPSARSSSPADSQADVRPTTTPREGDCVGADGPGRGGEVWRVDCAHRNAVARVTRLVPNGKSDLCIKDDYTGFDFRNDKPSLCLMIHGKEGDCYSAFDVRTPIGPRVACTDPKAVLRLQRIVKGDGRDTCRQITPYGDPNAAALFYSDAPDFDAGPGTFRDLTYCLTSPEA